MLVFFCVVNIILPTGNIKLSEVKKKSVEKSLDNLIESKDFSTFKNQSFAIVLIRPRVLCVLYIVFLKAISNYRVL